MALYTVRRSLPRTTPERELELIQIRAISTGLYQPQFLWHRTYGWEQETTFEGFCVYSGADAKHLLWQQRICAVPFDRIDEVEELAGARAGAGTDEPGSGNILCLAERHFEQGKAALLAANDPFLAAGGEVIWLRSFWDEAQQSSKCIFAARDEGRAREAVACPEATLLQLRAVDGNHPSFWTAVYDRLGLPHHWETAAAAV